MAKLAFSFSGVFFFWKKLEDLVVSQTFFFFFFGRQMNVNRLLYNMWLCVYEEMVQCICKTHTHTHKTNYEIGSKNLDAAAFNQEPNPHTE